MLRLVDLESCSSYHKTVISGYDALRFIYSSDNLLNQSSSTRLKRAQSARPQRQSKTSVNHKDSHSTQNGDVTINGGNENSDVIKIDTDVSQMLNGALNRLRPKTSIGFRRRDEEMDSSPDSSPLSSASPSSTSVGSSGSENSPRNQKLSKQRGTTKNNLYVILSVFIFKLL